MLHEYHKGSGDIAVRVAPGKEFALHEVRLHLAAAGGANNFTIARETPEGSEFAVVLKTQDMTSATDVVYQPTRPHQFREDEEIVCAWTNGSSIAWGLEVVWK